MTKYLIVLSFILTSIGPVFSEERELSNITPELEGEMTGALLKSKIPFISVVADLMNPWDSIYHFRMSVLIPKHRDLFHKDPDNLKAVGLAMEALSETIKNRPWKMKYFYLEITKPPKPYLRYLFLVEECKKYQEILMMDGPNQAMLYLEKTSLEALNRYKTTPDWHDWNEIEQN